MTFQPLTPTQFVSDGGGLDITANLLIGGSTLTDPSLRFINDENVFLIVVATTACTVTLDVESTVLGQAVAAFTPVSLTSGHYYAFGQFHSANNFPGTSTVQVVLSSIVSTVSAGLFTRVGVS